jgi:hypothetical protein
MNRTAQLAIAYSLGRVAYGIALTAVPGKVGESWIGEDARRPATQVAIRGLGARDLALAAGTIVAAKRGGALHGWLIGAVSCDVADIGATLAAGDAVPKRSRIGTVALAGASAVMGGALILAAGDR